MFINILCYFETHVGEKSRTPLSSLSHIIVPEFSVGAVDDHYRQFLICWWKYQQPFQLAKWKNFEKIHVKVQTFHGNSKGNSELFPHSCYMWLYTWKLKTTAPFSFVTFFYVQHFLPHAEKGKPWSAFHEKRSVRTDHNCGARSVYLIWFSCTLHCAQSLTFSFPSGRLGRQLASQQTPAPQLGSWHAALAALLVEPACLTGHRGTLTHSDPFCTGNLAALIGPGSEIGRVQWVL